MRAYSTRADTSGSARIGLTRTFDTYFCPRIVLYVPSRHDVSGRFAVHYTNPCPRSAQTHPAGVLRKEWDADLVVLPLTLRRTLRAGIFRSALHYPTRELHLCPRSETRNHRPATVQARGSQSCDFHLFLRITQAEVNHLAPFGAAVLIARCRDIRQPGLTCGGSQPADFELQSPVRVALMFVVRLSQVFSFAFGLLIPL